MLYKMDDLPSRRLRSRVPARRVCGAREGDIAPETAVDRLPATMLDE